MKVLANDGISDKAKTTLESQGVTVSTDHVEQERLIDVINTEGYEGLLVRSKPEPGEIASLPRQPPEEARGCQGDDGQSRYHCMVHPRRNHSSESRAAGHKSHQP